MSKVSGIPYCSVQRNGISTALGLMSPARSYRNGSHCELLF